MANYSLSISDAVSTGWEYAKKHGLLIAVIYLIVGVVSGGVQSFMGTLFGGTALDAMTEAMSRGDWDQVSRYANEYNSSIGSSLSTFVSIVISIIVSVGLYNLALGLLEGRFTTVEFEAFKLPVSTYLKFFLVELIVGLIIFISTLCCVIPAFFVAPRLVFASVYVIQNPDTGIGEAIKASWDMTKGNTISLIGLGFLLVGVSILGFLCCCIGVYFAEVVCLFTTIAAYNQLKGNLL